MCRMPQKMLQEANLVFLCKEVLDVFDTKLEVEGKKMYLLFAIFTEGEILRVLYRQLEDGSGEKMVSTNKQKIVGSDLGFCV